MEAFNRALFMWMNASAHPATGLVALAVGCAEYLIWLVPLLLGLAWLRGEENTRKAMLTAAMAGLGGLLLNQLIGLVWQHPRPFMIGLGHTLIPHVADSSFPSDHLTLWWSVAFSLLWQPRFRRWGGALAALGLPIAWARIYLGVHFPLDMLGAAAVAWMAAGLSQWGGRFYLERLYRLASCAHRALFGKLIADGWMRG
ncbi:undecaprenyl-diphosphatase [Chromobacterium paludis]|uniref:Undecaprenyl-diphosphatase n=1 Tax=Chromobacterium paludis TaxID=2605945 RepID=A0A5C1DGZ3_9NEIS|nr:undecaprenyl-diphosphatase [Chromobacterium paludis]QEL56030.1 undecaprenyl-diphosphatase [Chromobacterium paludis]